MVPLELASVGIVQGSSEVVLILRALHSGQMLIMAIGPYEGQAIARGAEQIEMPRPMTHDLLMNMVSALGARLKHVHIRDVQDQTFYATMLIEPDGGEAIEIDARPSDAVACAVRAGAPIFADPVVMALAGVRPQDIEGDEDDDDVDPADEDETDEDSGGTHIH